MSDKLRIEKMQSSLTGNAFFKRNVLSDLLDWIDGDGNLLKEVYVPQKERDCNYLKVVMNELGYVDAVYDEEYNGFHECYCYKITNVVRE